MFQPPESYKECPQCGDVQAILILDFDGLLPQLHSMGYPHYHCPNCANVFRGADIQQDEQGKGRNTGEKKEE